MTRRLVEVVTKPKTVDLETVMESTAHRSYLIVNPTKAKRVLVCKRKPRPLIVNARKKKQLLVNLSALILLR
jgi:hypothetical protein